MTRDIDNPSHSGKPGSETIKARPGTIVRGPSVAKPQAPAPMTAPAKAPLAKAPVKTPQKQPVAAPKAKPAPMPKPVVKPATTPAPTINKLAPRPAPTPAPQPISRQQEAAVNTTQAGTPPENIPPAERPIKPATIQQPQKSASPAVPLSQNPVPVPVPSPVPVQAPARQTSEPLRPAAKSAPQMEPPRSAPPPPMAKIIEATPPDNQPHVNQASARTADMGGMSKQAPTPSPSSAGIADQPQSVPKMPKREPKLERQYLPTGMPRPRASLTEKSRAPSIGGLIHSIQAKPSKTPYYMAAVTSAIWLVIGSLLGLLLVGQSFDDFTGYKAVLASSSFYVLAAAILVPIALFWFIAQLVVRSQEMKLMASAMTEVAIRLAEPDKMAEQKVASVGQTIRRQVSAMDDAISRAIGRAGELEALVHNEVAALERSYSQNEFIIRNLLNELVNEREAIAHNGLLVKQTLQGVGTQVALTMQGVGTQVAQSMQGVGTQVAQSMQGVSTQISKDIRGATAGIGEELTQYGNMSATKLQRAGDQVTKALKTTTDQTVAIKQKISAELPQLLDKMNVEQGKLGKVIEGANRNLGQLDTTLAQRTTEIDEVISRHTGELNKRLAQKVKALDASLAMRTKAMNKTLSTKASELNKTFLTHRDGIDETMQQKAREIDQAIASQAKAMDASLTEKARTIDAALTHRLDEINDQITQTQVASPQAMQVPETPQVIQQAPQITPAPQIAEVAQITQAPQANHKQTTASNDLSMLRGSEALERAMTAQSNTLNATLENNSANLAQTISQQNELSREITELSQKHSQLLNDQSDHAAQAVKQFSAQGVDLKATAGLLGSPDMKMSAMIGPQQNKARAVLADIAARSNRMEKERTAYASAIDNYQSLGEETAYSLKKLLVENGSPRAEQAINEVDQASIQSRQNTFETKKWMEDYSQSLSRHVVEMVTGMSRSSSRTKILPGEVTNTSTNVYKSVQEQLQALDAVAQIQNATVSSNQVAATRTGTPSSGRGTHGQGHRPSASKAGNTANTSLAKGAVRLGNADKPSQWSFGDLLARVADTDTDQGEQPLPAYRPANTSTSEHHGNGQTSLSNDPLDILRMDDIAHALDSHTAALAWKRSQAGEPNVFTRGLYTPDGQITFDQISQRLHNDEEFRSTVEKYVSDFEILMNEAKEKDPSGRIIQNYMTSETGRTYLMLAHISGRLH